VTKRYRPADINDFERRDATAPPEREGRNDSGDYQRTLDEMSRDIARSLRVNGQFSGEARGTTTPTAKSSWLHDRSSE
jgi:hypothetical protein